MCENKIGEKIGANYSEETVKRENYDKKRKIECEQRGKKEKNYYAERGSQSASGSD
jgi:hypothetical protein